MTNNILTFFSVSLLMFFGCDKDTGESTGVSDTSIGLPVETCEIYTDKKIVTASRYNFNAVYPIQTIRGRLFVKNIDSFWLWDWNNLTKTPDRIELKNLDIRCFSNGDLIASLPPPSPSYGPWRLGPTGKSRLVEYLPGVNWWMKDLGHSHNADHIVLGCEEKLEAVSDERFNNGFRGQYRVGVVNVKGSEPQWLTLFDATDFGPMVNKITVSNDGRLVAAVGLLDGAWAMVADVKAGKVLWSKQIGLQVVNYNAVCFTPDDKEICVGANPGVVIHNAETGAVTATWPTPGRCLSVAVSPNGRLIAAGTGPGGDVYIIDRHQNKILLHIKTDQFSIYWLVFSPDGKLLATSGSGPQPTGLKIWDMPTATEMSLSKEESL